MTRIEPRVQLAIEKLAALGGFRLRSPDDVPPMLDDAARVRTINLEAQIAGAWRWPREVNWWEVTAWRAEDAEGNELQDEDELELDGEHDEPTPIDTADLAAIDAQEAE